MQVERILPNTLQSQLEKVVEKSDQVTASSMLVDKDKRQKKQEGQSASGEEEVLIEEPANADLSEPKEENILGLLHKFHRVDLIA